MTCHAFEATLFGFFVNPLHVSSTIGLAMAEAVQRRRCRAASDDDSAKPLSAAGLSFIALAALSFFVLGYLRRRPGGRRLGEDSDSDQRNSQEDSRPNNDFSMNRRLDSSQPMSLEELRARRIQAMEAAGAVRLTPLGTMLLLSRKADELEEQVASFLARKGAGSQEQEKSQLADDLRQLQMEINAVKSDESVRHHRKLQTARVNSLIMDLER